MNNIERAIETQQKFITNWEQRIQELEEVIKKYPWGRDGLEYDFGDWRETELKRRKEQIKIALIIISALEEKLNGGWIPFKAEYDEEYKMDMIQGVLPDDEQEILVSDGKHVWVDEFIGDGIQYYLDSGVDLISDAIAWQPLPEPYKEVENE